MGTRVQWLLVPDHRVPEGDAWLGVREREVLGRLTVPKRRHDWRLGRWAAKRALVLSGNLPADELAEVEVVAAQDGAPELFGRAGRLPWVISLSHSGPHGVCAITKTAALGCDLETVEDRGLRFVEDYFTGPELETVKRAASKGPLVSTIIWSAKESLLKLTRTGLRRDTRRIEVDVIFQGREGWQPFAVRDRDTETTEHGQWQLLGNQVLTIVARPATTEPERLQAPGE